MILEFIKIFKLKIKNKLLNSRCIIIICIYIYHKEIKGKVALKFWILKGIMSKISVNSLHISQLQAWKLDYNCKYDKYLEITNTKFKAFV